MDREEARINPHDSFEQRIDGGRRGQQVLQAPCRQSGAIVSTVQQAAKAAASTSVHAAGAAPHGG